MTRIVTTTCDGCEQPIVWSLQDHYSLSFGCENDRDFHNKHWDVCSTDCAIKVFTRYVEDAKKKHGG